MSTLDFSITNEHARLAAMRLYFWQEGGHTNFTSLLFTLMQKADAENLFRLSAAYPYEAEALRRWRDAPTSRAFFESMGITG